MRAGIVHFVLGVIIVILGYVANVYFSSFRMDDGRMLTVYWWAAYPVGAFEIIRGIVIMARVRKLGR
jgi:hypothetical protein